MDYNENTYITARDLSFNGVLHDVKKSRTALQPIFEAFTNAIEAIKLKSSLDSNFKGEIHITINSTENTIQTHDFSSLTIVDNGIGFTDDDFSRFNTFKDSSKGFKNLGSGRIQFVHYFDKTVINSTFQRDEKFYEREFSVSKQKGYLDKNSIVLHRFSRESEKKTTGTSVSFVTLLENSNVYNELDEKGLKEHILKRYVHYFCYNKSDLPKIAISFYINSELKGKTFIAKKDIPEIHKAENIPVEYTKISDNAKSLIKTGRHEDFKIDAFKIQDDLLEKNDLKLVSKGEIVEDSEISLQSLPKGENVKGYKYLFLVSSNYIDSKDTNLRGILNIPTLDSLTKNSNLFSNEEIIIEDIQQNINSKINSMYPEIEKAKIEHDARLDELKEMFLLDDETAKSINISINDDEGKILEKFYEAEAKKTATIDAEIKQSIDNLNKLNTTSPTYPEELKREVERLVKVIPQQNKKSLTHYVARRKLVLDLLDKILKRTLDVQQEKENYDEALIHNLLFQQSSETTENSDLWIINEDFIYFKGSSEKQLSKVEIDGVKVFKEKFTEEENRYLNSLGENRKIKRPDVLLFPDEGKCIIIEFKAPHVNASDHLNQIDKYANLILNYTEEKFKINTFYGYLLGEGIESRDVRGSVSRYEESYHFDYLFRPSETVNGFEGRPNGSIYTEVIKYSTLLARAINRNKIFIEKLDKT